MMATVIHLEDLSYPRRKRALGLLRFLRAQTFDVVPMGRRSKLRRPAKDLAAAGLRVVLEDPSRPSRGLLILCHLGFSAFFAQLASDGIPGLTCWPSPRVEK